MKQHVKKIAAVALLAMILGACSHDDGIMSRSHGIYTVNTTNLTAEVKGFHGPTPLIVTIENNTITNIELTENDETPKFLARVTDGGLIEQCVGRSVDEILDETLAPVSGATYSSNAIIENIYSALQYYKEHK